MKRKLVKGGRIWEIAQYGSQIFVREVSEDGEETESSRTCFDEHDAVEKVLALIAAKHGQGFVLSEESLRDDAEALAVREREEALLVHYDSLASASDLGQALRDHFAPLALEDELRSELAHVVDRVESIELAGRAFTLHFSGGCRLVCTAPDSAPATESSPESLRRLLSLHEYLWFYDDDTNDHRLHFGQGAAPPIGDEELDGTELEGEHPVWFLEEQPGDCYWFLHPHLRRSNGEPMLCAYEFDGGLHDPVDRDVAAVVFERIRALLD